MYISASILYDGGWNPSCCWPFLLKTYIFWKTKWMHKSYQRFLCCLHHSLYFPSFLIVFHCYTPFCFLHIWNIVLNGWNSYYLCSDHCLRYSMNVSAKVDIEPIFWCSVLMDSALSLLPHMKLNEWLWLNGYLAFDKISCIYLCDIFMYMWLHCPMVMCIVSTIYIIFECWFIYGLVRSVFERSFSGEKI